MNGKQISLIYFYLVSAASLALIVIGIFNSVNYLVNVTQYDKYPLQYWEDTCSSMPYSYKGGPVPAVDMMPPSSTPSASEMEKMKQDCLDNVERQRKQRMIDDLKSSITFTLVGTILFLIHFPQARKQSREK